MVQNKNLKKKLKNLSVVITTHVYATGPAFFLEDYLAPKVKRLLFIGLPFSYAKDKSPSLRYWEKGKLIEEKKLDFYQMPEIITYTRDFLLVMWWVIKKGKFDLFIGADNLNALSGIILKKIGRLNKVIFYAIDFVPNRFNNPVLNKIYHRVEKFAVYKSDSVWNLSDVMRKEREKRGYDKKYSKKQIIVPIGTEPIERLSKLTEKQYDTITFMGHLREGQGTQFLIEVFSKALKRNPKFLLQIIGGGILEKSLRTKVNNLKIGANVLFQGFVKDFKAVKRFLSESGLAVAPYEDEESSFTKYTDPGKVKDYLSQGLPIIITKIPQVAFEVDRRKAGLAVGFNQLQFVDAILKITKTRKTQDEYRRNSLKMAKEYTWERIFDKALDQTLNS